MAQAAPRALEHVRADASVSEDGQDTLDVRLRDGVNLGEDTAERLRLLGNLRR